MASRSSDEEQQTLSAPRSLLRSLAAVASLLALSACAMTGTEGSQSAQGAAQPTAAQPVARPTPPDPGSAFRDCAACPEMVVVPAGSFLMGAGAAEEAAEQVSENFRGRSVPQHEVRIGSAFAVGRFEVTRGEFAAFLRESTHRPSAKCFCRTAIERYGMRLGTVVVDESGGCQSRGFRQSDHHPVVCVSWEDAMAYADWLSRKTGKAYRLLSESEWEYAARGGNAARRFWGDDPNQACSYANGADRAAQRAFPVSSSIHECNDGYAHTAPVGRFEANAFGLHDMLGNVWELVEDCWNENYHDAPSDGRAWTSGNCSRRVSRGGSWINGPGALRSADRAMTSSSHGSGTNLTGFRVARTL